MDIVEEENKHKYMYHPTTIAVRGKRKKKCNYMYTSTLITIVVIV